MKVCYACQVEMVKVGSAQDLVNSVEGMSFEEKTPYYVGKLARGELNG
jgi:hypothetical protein